MRASALANRGLEFAVAALRSPGKPAMVMRGAMAMLTNLLTLRGLRAAGCEEDPHAARLAHLALEARAKAAAAGLEAALRDVERWYAGQAIVTDMAQDLMLQLIQGVIPLGMRFRISGLRSRADLNGRIGWVVGADYGRLQMALDGLQSTVSVKVDNLSPPQAAAPAAPAAPTRSEKGAEPVSASLSASLSAADRALLEAVAREAPRAELDALLEVHAENAGEEALKAARARRQRLKEAERKADRKQRKRAAAAVAAEGAAAPGASGSPPQQGDGPAGTEQADSLRTDEAALSAQSVAQTGSAGGGGPLEAASPALMAALEAALAAKDAEIAQLREAAEAARSCGVCFEDKASRQETALLPCGHTFCAPCCERGMPAAAGGRRCCALCRTAISGMQRLFQ